MQSLIEATASTTYSELFEIDTGKDAQASPSDHANRIIFTSTHVSICKVEQGWISQGAQYGSVSQDKIPYWRQPKISIQIDCIARTLKVWGARKRVSSNLLVDCFNSCSHKSPTHSSAHAATCRITPIILI